LFVLEGEYKQNVASMIGKTRQERAAKVEVAKIDTAEVEEIYDPEVGKARGVLRRPLPAGKLRHARRSPSSDLSFWIAHYWMIRWDLRGCDPHVAESLPHPNIHVIFEPDASVVCGVHTSKFSRLLEGQSQVFGIKFKPGAFRSFLKFSTSKLANRMMPAKSILGKDVDALQAIVLSSRKEDEKVEAANAFFRARLPEPDKTVELVGQLVERILRDREIKTVDDLVGRSGIGKRSLQRMFNEYVGVSPKWVIRRYRLHELIERSHSGDEPDWSQLALELGYFDQAHLINDFRSITGYSPTEYQALIRRD
jgi:AraC-like DNA-binding protein